MKLKCSVVPVFLIVAGCAVQALLAQQLSGLESERRHEKQRAADSAADSAVADEVAPVPGVKLTVSDPKPVGGVPEFHMWAQPVLCGSDGTPYVVCLILKTLEVARCIRWVRREVVRLRPQQLLVCMTSH